MKQKRLIVKHPMASIFLALYLFLISWLSISSATADNSATALVYHRFGEDKYPSTNIKMDQFQAQLDYLAKENFEIWPLSKILAAFQTRQPMPDKVIAITVDDAFLSVYEKAWPLLKARNIPLTIFVATEAIDQKNADFMRWDHMREMQSEGVEFAAHSHRHIRLPALTLEKAQAEIMKGINRIEAELGQKPHFFAYPYGAASKALMAFLEETGLQAGFGQHSGVMSPTSPQFYFPRFPINEAYGDLKRFALVSASKAFTLSDQTPDDPTLGQKTGDNPPALGFTLNAPDAIKRKNFNCYQSGFGRLENLQWLGQKRIEIRFDTPFKAGMTRINCTYPDATGRWYWHGWQFYVPS